MPRAFRDGLRRGGVARDHIGAHAAKEQVAHRTGAYHQVRTLSRTRILTLDGWTGGEGVRGEKLVPRAQWDSCNASRHHGKESSCRAGSKTKKHLLLIASYSILPNLSRWIKQFVIRVTRATRAFSSLGGGRGGWIESVGPEIYPWPELYLPTTSIFAQSMIMVCQ